MSTPQETITTTSVGKGFAKTNLVLLKKTPTTALVFAPEIHEGGVRGVLIRYKKNKNDDWEQLSELDFRTLNLHEGVKIELGTEQLRKLVEETNKRNELVKQGVEYGHKEYVVAGKDKVLLVDDSNVKDILQQILEDGYSDDFWTLVRDSNPDLADKLSAGHIQLHRQNILSTLKQRLTEHYPETAGADSWQKWIYMNNWLFGVNYQEPIEKQKISITGIMPDYLFPTVDGFVDVLEIKLPSMEVIEEDKSHKGSWAWSKDANYAIGQVVNYLCELDRLRLEIERLIGRDVSILKPRAHILIGNSEKWDKNKKEGLRKLNYSLHGIEVITYHHLTQRGQMFIESNVGIQDG